jgi:streptogramin lyase
VDIKERLVREIPISNGPNGPDWTVGGFGSVWVKRDDGVVVRVDPEDGRILAEIPSGQYKPGEVCQGFGLSDEAVWACPHPGTLSRIDPETNEVTDTLSIKSHVDQGRYLSAAGYLWVLTDSGRELTGIDPDTGKPSTSIPLDTSCFDLGAAEDVLWVSCYVEDRLLRVDAKAEQVTDEIELGRPISVSVGEDVWVGFEEGVAQVDDESMEVSAVYDVFPGLGGRVRVGSDAVWVREDGGVFLTRIDPVEQEIVEQIKAPDLPSGGDVLPFAGSLWATAYDDKTLVQLRCEPACED